MILFVEFLAPEGGEPYTGDALLCGLVTDIINSSNTGRNSAPPGLVLPTLDLMVI